MTSIVLDGFGGIAPKISPKKLSDQIATVAENVRLDQSRLDGWRGIKNVSGLNNETTTVFKYQGKWIESVHRRSYARTPIPNDDRERIFFTDSDYPKFRTFDQEFRLGIPKPEPTHAVVKNKWEPGTEVEGYEAGELPEERPEPNAAPLDFDDRAYRFSLVDAFGNEGSLSLATAALPDVYYLDVVEVTLPAVPAGDYNFSEGAKWRVYRNNTGTQGNVFQFLRDVEINAKTFDDVTPAKELQEVAPNEDWIEPPNDDKTLYPDGALAEMLECPGGFLFGWSGNQFCFSEPYLPHAWPAAYRKAHSDRPVAACVVNGGIFVATDEQPVLIAGNHPAAMAIMPIDSDHACLSRESMVDMGGYALYASTDGLVRAEGASTQIVTSMFFTREQWQSFKPSKLIAYKHEGKYFAENPETGLGFCFDPAGDTATFTNTSGLRVKSYYYDIETDKTFVVYGEGDESNLGEFNEGEKLPYRWRSKEFVLPQLVFFAVGRLEARGVNKFRLWADDSLVFEADIHGNVPFRLPLLPESKRWQFEVESSNSIEMIGIYGSMGEVK
ncbi:hypothetical protein [Parendozoicomonas haliclonae]|uniref:Uncharacterized protein n=1 Tax=Parendozoicomonas haliclonae TaxID=1960125 RepID=A0A1X7AGL3_9GAMM|nr:hypothetical protein [Parendozoicomonas haliclonae]SMA33259.1 hypothetical protein EHSB41UT_00249 [Parendozoicomonas haliclonae]